VTKKFLSHRKRIRFCHTFFIALFLPFSDVGYTLLSGKFEKEIYKWFHSKIFLFLFYFNYINLLVSGYQNF